MLQQLLQVPWRLRWLESSPSYQALVSKCSQRSLRRIAGPSEVLASFAFNFALSNAWLLIELHLAVSFMYPDDCLACSGLLRGLASGLDSPVPLLLACRRLPGDVLFH